MTGTRQEVADGQQQHVRRSVEVVVRKVLSTHNLFRYDRERDELWLAAVVRREEEPGLEVAEIPRTWAGGGPLAALVISPAPTFPGCRLRLRVIGAVRGGDGLVLVGLPEADEGFPEEWGPDDLPPGLRGRIADIVGAADSEDVWLDAEAAWSSFLAAREAYGRLQQRPLASAVWRAPFASEGASGEGPEPWENLLPWLPTRFQRYVRELLLPDERVLAFVERPALVRGPVLRRQRLSHGVLLVTDRQLLLVEDALPPSQQLHVDWGYAALSLALERVGGCSLREGDGWLDLKVEVEAAGGAESISVALPPSCEDGAGDVLSVLEAFTRRGPLALQRRYSAEALQGAGLADPIPREEQAPDMPAQERLLALAASRVCGRGDVQPCLAVSDGHLGYLERARRAVGWKWVPLGAISSLRLHHFLMGCWLEAVVPQGEHTHTVRVEYEYPESEAFRRCFLVARHLLGLSPRAGGEGH